MASPTLYCSCFSGPPVIHSEKPTQKEEIYLPMKSRNRGPSQAAARIGFTHFAYFGKSLYALQHPGMKILSGNNPNRAKYIAGLRCLDYMTTMLDRSTVRYLPECSGINMVISGYWVGPDGDDGWGYTEAVVDRSSC